MVAQPPMDMRLRWDSCPPLAAAEAGSVGDAHGIRGARVEAGPLRQVEETFKSPKTGALNMPRQPEGPI